MAILKARVARPAAAARGRAGLAVRASGQRRASGSAAKVALPALLAGLTSARPALAEASRDLLAELSYPSGSAPIPVASKAVPAPSLPSVDLPSVELPSVELPAVDFPTDLLDNPLLIGGALTAVAVPLLIKAFSSGTSIKTVSPAAAFEALAEADDIVFIDIRTKAEAKEEGSPDVRSTGKKLVPIPLSKMVKGELVTSEEAFVTSLAKVANPEEHTLMLIDTFGPEAAKAAKLAAAAGFKQVVYVKGGCEGPGGWRQSELPWKEPFRIDLESLKKLDITGMTKLADKLAEEYKESPTVVKGGLAVAAAGAAAFVLFNEVEIILEVLGVWAAAQFLAKKLLFAEDRERTLKQIKSLFSERIAAGEAGEDLKRLASTVFQSETVEGIEPQVEAAKAAEMVEGSAEVEEEVPEKVEEAPEKVEGAAEKVEEVAEEAATTAADDIAGRKADVQAWVSAWRERSQVPA
mmetsp:Transcript_39619/g.100490  ORF Transcript_39619/g.100490 Transcript_39619/m.100490 type:complete len:465 (+) Transcript_39619:109-1503(+)